jgi:hypothetical protein
MDNYNYYCNGFGFKTYSAACKYSNECLEETGYYFVVYTRAEIDSQINHVEECGK